MSPKNNAFHDIPANPVGHFVLNLYSAVYCLIHYACFHDSDEGDEWEARLDRYPFLGAYLNQMAPYMPPEITWVDALAWWRRELDQWEQAYQEPLPLRALTKSAKLSFESRVALMITGLVEEDARFATLAAEFDGRNGSGRPTCGFVARVGASEETPLDPWAVCRPLIDTGIVDVLNPTEPRSAWELRVPTAVWDLIRGDAVRQPIPGLQFENKKTFEDLDQLALPRLFVQQLKRIPDVLMTGQPNALILRGSEGSSRNDVIGALARACGLSVIAVDSVAMVPEEIRRISGPICILSHSMPVFTCDPGPGETISLSGLLGYRGPIGVLLGFSGGLDLPGDTPAVTLSMPALEPQHRAVYWRRALNGHAVTDLGEICSRYMFPGDHIKRIATAAATHATLAGRAAIAHVDIQAASRSLNREHLDSLAAPIEAEGSWELIVTSSVALSRLKELESRCRHRESVSHGLGQAFGSDFGPGVRALFTGASGTGKTLAARVIAAELGMDLYRVDLAAIVNKYVGETEKNLHRVLAAAEDLDVILLMDEGDALLASRTDVRTANDRYANLETDFLLQRLESYRGIVIVTTNAGENIDNAFRRRMDVVVSFGRPRSGERWRLWNLHLPVDHAVGDPFLREIAVSCEMTGGQIRNAVLHAALLALDDGRRVIDAPSEGGRHF